MKLKVRGQLARKASIGVLALAITMIAVSAEAGKRHRCIAGGGIWMISAGGKMCMNTLSADIGSKERFEQAKGACAKQHGALREEDAGFVCMSELKPVETKKKN